MIRTEKIEINDNHELLSYMNESLQIYDQALYFLRQSYFYCRDNNLKIKTPNSNQLYHLVKETSSWLNANVESSVKNKAVKQAFNNWKSFIKSTISFNKNKHKHKFKAKPKIPGYLYKRKQYNQIEFGNQRFKRNTGNFIHLLKSNFKFKLPNYINKEQIKLVRIYKYYDKIKINIIYEKEDQLWSNTGDSIAGIDLGVNNLMAITINNQEKSWIVKGGPAKSLNQYYNKQKAKLSSKKAKKQLQKLNRKRNNKIKDYFHKTSSVLIQLCLTNGISKLVIGKNQGWKQNSKMGKQNNQSFVGIPFNLFINMIKYKAEEFGIKVTTIEESYTSKIDHLAFEDMKHQDKYLGRRVSRGLFKSSIGKIINADINGAIGILRKTGLIDDDLVNRNSIKTPKVINIFKQEIPKTKVNGIEASSTPLHYKYSA